jgi:putative transposase
MVKLTDKKIKWAVKQVINKGESTAVVAAIYGVSRRRIQQLVERYKETSEYPVLDHKRRPRILLSAEEKRIIEDAYDESFLGARLLRYHLQKHYNRNVPQNKIHQHLLEVGLARPNPKKQKKRKRCRYERKHSLSLVHADWLDYDGVQVIAFEDDASRKILSIGGFSNATTENAITAFKRAEEVARAYRGYIIAVNTDQGSQFYASGGEKKSKGVSRFEQYLNARGVRHIPSKRNNPQTNGKIERWFQEYRKHRWRFESEYAFAEWYNNRIHGALDLDCGETPNEAFIRKIRGENLRGLFLDRTAREVNL